MKIRLRDLRLIDKPNDFFDLLIEDGYIRYKGPSSKFPKLNCDRTYDLKGNFVSAGWVDMRALCGEPGYEHKETIASLTETAKKGGFTHVCVMPNTKPVINQKSDLQYFIKKSQDTGVILHPLAAATIDTKGEDLSEMLDLHAHGAIAFSDGLHPVHNADRLLKILQYLSKFDGLLINHSHDPLLNLFGMMHEGEVSTRLGLKGMPSLAEEVAIMRDLELLRYAGGKMHFTCISTARSVSLIKEAKKEGLNVTCDVAAYHLLLTDRDLMSFDTNYKVNPPLRTESDVKALIKGLKEGVIDSIVSNHQPVNVEGKDLEFDLADFGMINLQTVFSQLVALEKQVSLELLLKKISEEPRKILGLPIVTLNEGELADLTIFDPSLDWQYDANTNTSAAENSPFLGKKLKGKVTGTVLGTMTNID